MSKKEKIDNMFIELNKLHIKMEKYELAGNERLSVKYAASAVDKFAEIKKLNNENEKLIYSIEQLDAMQARSEISARKLIREGVKG